jgi:hypothetical protein
MKLTGLKALRFYQSEVSLLNLAVVMESFLEHLEMPVAARMVGG